MRQNGLGEAKLPRGVRPWHWPGSMSGLLPVRMNWEAVMTPSTNPLHAAVRSKPTALVHPRAA